MNTIGTAMLHVTRTAGLNGQSAGVEPGGLGLGLAAWIARAFTWVGRIGRA